MKAVVDAPLIPAVLRAGACVEVWSDPVDARPDYWTAPALWRRHSARRNWSNARDAWLAAHHFSQLRPDEWPELQRPCRLDWSFYRLAGDDPERLVERLHRCGLPADWTPRRSKG